MSESSAAANPDWKARAQSLTPTQLLFVEWNAQRLGIAPDESLRRFLRSAAAVPNGHAGTEFRAFNSTCYELYQVFWDDNARELFEAYRFHAPMHFLRMLSYGEPSAEESLRITRNLPEQLRTTILDFGCGLAQQSRGLAQYLARAGRSVQLVLADIPTVRKEFLLWLGSRAGIRTTFLDCTPETPIPLLPEVDVVIATEFFEHVPDPLAYLAAFDSALRLGGILVTNISDHDPEFMHVAPSLHTLRARVAALGYEELEKYTLFRKRMPSAAS